MGRELLFSVVIPTFGRPGPLTACLQGLSTLHTSRDRFEVVVSDDGSPFSLEPVVSRCRERLQITLLTRANRGPAAARNHGAAHARGKYLVFLDDDCVPRPDWLARLEERFAKTPDRLIGGGIVNALPANAFSTATQLITSYVYGYFDRGPKSYYFFTTSNFAVPAAAFRELGGFSEAFPLPAGEDYDFCHRWQHAGMRTVYAAEAVVLHAHHLTLTTFWKQHFNYGRGLFTCRLRIARRTGKRLRWQGGSFYIGLLRYPLTHSTGAQRWLHTSLVVLSQVATAAGVLRQLLATILHHPSTAPTRSAAETAALGHDRG